MTQLSFSHHIGIDVSKDKLDVWLLPDNQHLQVTNNSRGLKQLIKHLPETAKIVLEATGGYERPPARLLARHGFQVCVTNPMPIYHYRKSLNFSAKTDKIDARVIAQYASEMTHLHYGLVSDEQLELGDYESMRETLRKTITQTKNRRTRTLNPVVKKFFQQQLALLEKQLEKIEALIMEKINASELMNKRYHLLQTVPGIGPKIAMTLICQLPELGKFEHRPLAKLVGLAPMANDSGKFQGKRFIRGGRSNVRRAMYMGALVATQFNPVIRKYYQARLVKGKAKKSALVACMNKLLRVLNSVAKNQKDFYLIEKEDVQGVNFNYGTAGDCDDRGVITGGQLTAQTLC